MKKFLIGFFLINLLLSSFFIDVWTTPNTGSRALPLLSLFEEHTLQIDAYERFTLDKSLVDGHFYSDKAPLSTFITLPFYGLIKLLRIDKLAPDFYPAYPSAFTDNHEEIKIDSSVLPGFFAYATGSFICGSLPFAVAMLLAFISIRKNSSSPSPVLLVSFTFYGSFLFVFSGAFFGHLLAGVFLLIAYIFLKQKKSYFIAGLALGAAFLTEYPVIIALPVWAALALFIDRDWKKALHLGLGALPGIVLNSVYWFFITGSPFKSPYSYVSQGSFAQMKTNLGFGFPKMEALVGLVFGQYRGALFYAPVLMVFVIALFKRRTFKVGKTPANYVTILSLIYLILFSSYYMWWGGWSLGPRHLIPVILLLFYEGLIFISNKGVNKYIFFLATSAGLAISWLAKSTIVFFSPEKIKNPVWDLVIPEFRAGRLNPNNFLSTLFGVPPGIAVYAWPVLFIFSMAILATWYRRVARAAGQ